MEKDTEWTGNPIVFRTYLEGCKTGDGKSPSRKYGKIKGVQHLETFEEASKHKRFGALMNEGFVDISFDSEELSQQFWDMAEKNNWNCLILENIKNGHMHSFWKDTKGRITKKSAKDAKLAVGLIADIHSGDTYIPLRVDGFNRFPPSFEPAFIDEVPDELLPVNTTIDLLNMEDGDGRDSAIFAYENILKSQVTNDWNVVKRIIKNINQFIFKDALSDADIERLTREDAIPNDVQIGFFKGKTFQHDKFGDFLKDELHIIRIDGQLHIYKDGIYYNDITMISNAMREYIPGLKKSQKAEVFDYLLDVTQERSLTSPDKIAFQNGIYDLTTGNLLSFSPDYVITNMIPWNYNDAAYSELADKTLDKISCGDVEIRELLEECIGYCFYRQNVIQKAFILIGDRSNGKSTFIGILNKILGDDNVAALDLKNLGDRFSTASLFKKLANIGDDISDDFISDSSLFKKIVSGDKVKGEMKGQKEFFFNPYVKLVFSANNLPRIKDKTGAVIRRLVLVPFNATFSEDDPDFDPNIKFKLYQQDSMEYLIRLGIDGLVRLLNNKKFTKSGKAQKELDDYEEFNNPVLGFVKEQGVDFLFRETTKEVYMTYSAYCIENGYIAESNNQFGRTLKSMYGVESKNKTVNGKSVRMYVKITE